MLSHATPARPRRRAGVTLIELLVVMAIITTLASLVIGAVFSLREAQMKTFTETTINKLYSALDQQWKAVLDQSREETVPGWAVKLAGDDLRRARVIYTKGRLKQEFPVTFAQAVNPGADYLTGATTQYVSAGNLPPKPTYVLACSGVTPPATWESSALLYLILSQGRRGMAAVSSPDDIIESTAIQTVTANGKQFRIFVDSYGNPLRFYAFPTTNSGVGVDTPPATTDELQQPPFVNANAASFPLNGRDPVDPEGTLYSPQAAWTNQLRAQFAGLIHPLAGRQPANATARYLIPAIASAGRDGNWGIDAITMKQTNADQAGDNIYSYRLRRSGARGD